MKILTFKFAEIFNYPKHDCGGFELFSCLVIITSKKDTTFYYIRSKGTGEAETKIQNFMTDVNDCGTASGNLKLSLLAMAHSDRGMVPLQELSYGGAHYLAPTENNSIGTGYLYASEYYLQQGYPYFHPPSRPTSRSSSCTR